MQILNPFLVVEFLKGELPWSEESDRAKIVLLKLNCRNHLFENSPCQLHQLYDLFIPLSVMEQPPYLICKSKLEEMFCK